MGHKQNLPFQIKVCPPIDCFNHVDIIKPWTCITASFFCFVFVLFCFVLFFVFSFFNLLYLELVGERSIKQYIGQDSIQEKNLESTSKSWNKRNKSKSSNVSSLSISDIKCHALIGLYLLNWTFLGISDTFA